MKNILISIKPEHCYNILNKNKILEIRTTCPMEWKKYLDGKTNVKPKPRKVYINCTKGKDLWMHDKSTIVLGNTDLTSYYLNGKVVAEFTLKYIIRFDIAGLEWWNMKEPILESACLTKKQLEDYIGDKIGYAWRIKDLKIYDKPKELDTFVIGKVALDCGYGNYNIYNKVLKRPPQSWCYVEGD